MPSKKTVVPLQRGTACLCCRKRKLKCDGTRPVCRQCTKTNRPEKCEYDDKKQKSRTQKLREKLTFLEERIRELESDPGGSVSSSSSSNTMPNNHSPVPSKATSFDSTGSPHGLDFASLSALDSMPAYDAPFGSPTWAHIPSSSSSSSSTGSVYNSFRSRAGGNNTISLGDDYDSEPSIHSYFEMSPFNLTDPSFHYMPRWDPNEPLPQENKKLLIDIFLAHRHQCWFDARIDRFDVAQPANAGPEPHPALMNTIYLLACHFARSPSYTELAPVFFTRALRDITTALDNSDRLVDIVQASCLLAVYLYANCRPLEGYCHSFSAARLAVGLGLHQLTSPDQPDPASFREQDRASPGYTDEPTPIPISPPRDQFEVNDRVTAFWQVFMVDRCWSVANGLPVALPDGDCPQSWLAIASDSQAQKERPDGTTVNALFESQAGEEEEAVYIPALRAKAAALYERTFRLLAVADKNDSFWGDHRAAELALQRFAISLPSFVGYETWRSQAPLVDVDLFTIHTMVHVSSIHLQKDIFQKETLQAVNSIMSLIRQLNDEDYEYLDPILSACWSSAAKTFLRILNVVGKSSSTEHSSAYTVNIIEAELDLLINAMKTLSAFFPLAGDHARKIEQERAHTRASLAAA